MIFGYTEDKNKVEVPSKEEIDERLSDTGWVTLAEAGTYDNIVMSQPLQYRKIGNKVHWRGNVSKISASTASNSFSHTFTGVPSDIKPPAEVKNTVGVNVGSSGVQAINITFMTMGHIYLHIYSETAISSQSLGFTIDTEYIVDQL